MKSNTTVDNEQDDDDNNSPLSFDISSRVRHMTVH